MSPVDGVESSQYSNSAEDLSFSILNLANQFELSKFREIEKISEKIIKLSSHLSFNETCLNIYIYI